MTSFDRMERNLPELLDELAGTHVPDYLDTVLRRTGRTRQRPGWIFLERWLPMSAISERLASAPRVPLRAAVVVALLLLALAAAVAFIAGSRPDRVPAPFGLAGNGLIAYVDDGGAIHVGDIASGRSSVVVAGPGNERPVFSPDGARFAHLRKNAIGNYDVVVADDDGSNARVISSEALLSVGDLTWTPDGRSVVVAVPPGDLLAFDAARAAPPRTLASNLGAVGDGFHIEVASRFRPPAGDEVLFVSGGASPSLVASRLDGSNARTVLDSRTLGFDIGELGEAQWSPDGSQIAVFVSSAKDPSLHTVYVLRADGTGVRPLRVATPGEVVDEGWPAWSPDGTKIALNRWTRLDDGNQDSHPIGVVDVASGITRDLGVTSVNGWVQWGWSPDGKSILEVPGTPNDDANRLLVVDATTGEVTRTEWSSGYAPSWQRTAP